MGKYLGKKLDSIGKVADIEGGGSGICDSEVDEGIDLDQHVITSNDGLLAKIDDVLSHIDSISVHVNDSHGSGGGVGVSPVHLTCTLNKRNNESETRLQGSLESDSIVCALLGP